MSYRINNAKNAVHGFFLNIATTVAEPATIMPLIVHHFSSSEVLVGLFASLLRGGAVVVQLFAAFYAQEFSRVMPYLRVVFLFRFLAWFGIGAAIFFFGESRPAMTLWLIGIGLFLFSFPAGFGQIYFKEIIAKVFSRQERGRTMANKQLFASLGALISGGVAGWVLERFDAPLSFAMLFMVSALFMAIGLLTFLSIKEPDKIHTVAKEKHFGLFLRNARTILRNDRRLRLQISAALLGYAFLLAMPFVILQAKSGIALSGWLVGGFVSVQMLGSIIGNFFLWRRFGSRYVTMMQSAYLMMITAFVLAFFADTPLIYGLIFFCFGVGLDGFRNADMNLVLEIAPEAKRPVYVAIQSTIVSLGLFFSIPGGFILNAFGFEALYSVTLLLLLMGLAVTRKLRYAE